MKVLDLQIHLKKLTVEGKPIEYAHIWCNETLIGMVHNESAKFSKRFVVQIYGNWCRPTQIICKHEGEIIDRVTSYMLDSILSLFTAEATAKLKPLFNSFLEEM